MWNKRLPPAVPEGDRWGLRCSPQSPAVPTASCSLSENVRWEQLHFSLWCFICCIFCLFACFSAGVPSRAGSSAAPSRRPRVACSALCSSSDTHPKGEETGPETAQGACELPWTPGWAGQRCCAWLCHFTPEMLRSKESKWSYFPSVLLLLKIVRTCYIFPISLSLTALKAQGEICVWEWEKMFLRWFQMDSLILKKKKKKVHISI